MVNNHGHPLEEPVVRAVANKVHVIGHILGVQATPSFADKRPYSRLLDGFQEKRCQCVGVIHDNTAKAAREKGE